MSMFVHHRGRGEEPADRQPEPAGQGEDLVGVELADPAAGEGALDGREAGRRELGAEVGLELGRGLFLGPAPHAAGLVDAVGDDLVRGPGVLVACGGPCTHSSQPRCRFVYRAVAFESHRWYSW